MKFIIGIGNPGSEYSRTRHNIGFLAVDALKKKLSSKVSWKKEKSLEAELVEIRDGIFLVKPWTYVNQTGQTVSGLVKKFGAHGAEILVVCDDVNLEFGKMRLRASGSSGGHHGLESVMQVLGSGDFPRLRMGVGNAAMPKDLAEFVLGRFDADEVKALPKILEKTACVCERWLDEGFEKALATLSLLQSAKE